MKPERIVLVAPFGLRPKGTTSARVVPIGRVLAEQGASVRIVVPPWDDPQSAGQVSREPGLEIVHAQLAGGPLQPLALLRETQRLASDFDPDLIHVFKPIGYSGLLGWWRSSWGRGSRPLVVLDTDDLEGPRGWSTRRSLGFLGWIRGWQELQTIRAIPRVTVASRWLQSFVGTLGVHGERVFWMPQGWSRDRAAPVIKASRVGPPTLLWYTRFTEARPERAAALFAPLLAADPTRRLLVYGDEVNPGAQNRARQAFAQAQVANQVEWQPYLPGGLNGLLAEHPITLALYPMEDDLANWARCPTKLAEIMAAGVPVVAEAVGEANSYLGDLWDDCLAPPGDTGRFRELCERYLVDAAERETLGKRLTEAAQQWEWGQIAHGLLDWYTRMQRFR